MTKMYALKGVNDDAGECSVCGKTHLRKVMWLVSLDVDGNADSIPFPVGTSCGAKMLGYSYSKVSTKVKNFDYEVRKRRNALEYSHPLTKQADDCLNQLNDLGIRDFKERMSHPLMIKRDELKRQVQDWIMQQEILIEL